MKKTLTLISLLMLYTGSMRAQSCSAAQDLSTYSYGSALSQSSQEHWYYFTAAHQDLFLDVLKMDTTFYKVDSVFAYGNSCGALSLLKSFGRPVGWDSVGLLEMRVKNLTVSATYYLRIKLKTAAAYSARYSLGISNAAAGACDLIINGDFENLGPTYPCPPIQGPLVGCTLGANVIPSWQSGSHGGFWVGSVSCPTYCLYNNGPHSGIAVAKLAAGGINYNWSTNSTWPGDFHNFFRTTLSGPLTINQKYYVQLFYKLGASSQGNLPGDGLGMYLSAGAPTMNVTNGAPNYDCAVVITPTLTPQIQNPAGNIMGNTTWLPLGGIYTPVIAGVDHITIGNFKPSNATTFSNSPLFGWADYDIDDVSITPLGFSITPVSICQGMTAQLSPTPCTPPFCTSSYSWFPATALGNANSLNTSASPSVTTTYTLTQVITNATGSAVATNTAQVTITVTPGSFTWSAGATSQVVCTNLGQSAITLTATSGSASPQYVWYPNQWVGPMQPITPTASAVYTVEASLGNCVYTKTVSITVSTVCCTSTVNAITSANLVGQNINGPAVINQDLLISGNAISSFNNGEFLMAPGVKITVLGGSQLELYGVHLYACSATMWQGIEVKNGGRVLSVPTTTNTTLIEDAVTAIEIDNVNSVPSMSLTELTGVIFNKNYVAVSINNATTNAVPNFMVNNVFTSRSLTFTPTQWPTAGTSAPGLREATSPTTGLAPPYALQSATLANLKNPYSYMSGYIGIRITNVGNTAGLPSFGVQVGQSVSHGTGPDNFNLFDNLGYGIYAENSNVNSTNNVYQNMQRVSTLNGVLGGDGIYHAALTTMNTRLDLNDPYFNTSSSAGNRFWSCYKAVNGTNIMQFYASYGIYRSRQSNAAGNGLLPGNTGIYLSTSRFEYMITNNQFNNLRFAVNIPVIAGTNNVGGVSNGIYAGYLLLNGNYFGAQTSSSLAIVNEYMNKAISVSSPNGTGWQNPYGWGLGIQSNTMNRVYRGITVNGMNSYATSISTNSITLVSDIMTSSTQRGIELVNTLNNSTVLQNTLSTAATGNTLITLVYSGLNMGVGSPSICCNRLMSGARGFEFSSNNGGTIWKGNVMNNLGRGMTLSSNGIIGQQGTAGNPSDNQWTNYVAGGNNGTWTEGASNAINSILQIRNTLGVYLPPNNNGQFGPNSYLQAGALLGTTGSYTCGAALTPPPAMIMSPPLSNEEASEDMLYSSAANLYRFLDEHPAQLDSSEVLKSFYDSLKLGSTGTFKQVETKLFKGEAAQANTINTGVIPVNNAEWTYKSYYQLYNKFLKKNFTTNDSTALFELASLCPGNDGPAVYQARALYNHIYQTVLDVAENCEGVAEQGARKFTTSLPKKALHYGNIKLFPNPSSGQINLSSSSENDTIELSIKDLSGRVLANNTIIVRNYSTGVNLHLKEGIYLVTLKNSKNELITKKLVITN